MRWLQAQPQGRARQSCEGHTVSVVDRTLYILFGKHEDDCGNVSCPPLTMFDTDTGMLSTPHIAIDAAAVGRQRMTPSDREGHSAAVIDQRIYVFGGTWTDLADVTLYMNDLHILDTSSKPPSWSRPPRTPSNPAPIEREGHTAVVIGRRMIVFGGTWVDEEDQSRYLNDVHVLDAARNWWSQPDTLGTPPIEREGHTASAVGRRMYVFGGAGLDSADHSINLADLHILDADTWTWSQPKLGSDVLPQERRYHTATVVERRLYVFGGQYYEPTADLHFECDNIVSCLDLESMTWQTLQVEGQPPLRRACHSAGAVGKRLYIVGGRYWDIESDDYIFMNDIQLLDTAAASTFAADWRAYFNNGHLSDIELRVEGRSIPAHRVVLAARCEYFARLLVSGMREAQGGVILVDGVRYDIFLSLLEYLYTDTLDFPPESALELLTAADRYGLDRLKRECVSSVEACLRTCTVCHVLTVADQHLADDLKEVCLHFITSNFPEVIRTDGFHSLSRDLLEQVHRAMASRHYPDKEAKLEKQGSPASAGRNGGSSSGSRLSIRQLSIGGMSSSVMSSANGPPGRHSLDSDTAD